jgi:hypothetical protein
MSTDTRPGLIGKFHVERVAPSSRGIDHADCRYFVLDPQHDPFAWDALSVYAEACRVKEPALAVDLRRWLAAILNDGAAS